jgi:hypothetical protein
MEEREFDYDNGGHGVITGNYGSLDTGWNTTPTAGTWHYVAVTYDGTNLLAYMDGSLNVTHVIGVPIATVQTLMQVGSGISGNGINGGNDPFHGYIACARVESGILKPADVTANYAMGPLGTAAAATPSTLTAIAGDGQVVLSWNSSVNAASYNVKSSTNNGGPYTVIAPNLAALSYTNTGLVDGTTYYYVVSATNAAGEGAASNVAFAQPTASAPPHLGFGINGGQLQFNWPPDHTGWNLQVQTDAPAQGIGTGWATVPASSLTNQWSTPLASSAGSVFFRLAHP